MKEGRKLEYLEKTPDHKLQKMPHTEAQKFKLQDSNLHWLQARKADVLTITPRVAPISLVAQEHSSVVQTL